MRYEKTISISERLDALLELIREGGYSTIALSNELRVSEPTINRDIQYLREKGHGIKAVREEKKWAYRIECQPNQQAANSRTNGAKPK